MRSVNTGTDLVAVFGGASHQLPVEEHVADDRVDVPAAVEALELDLDERRGGYVEAHGQLEAVRADRRRQVAQTPCIQRRQLRRTARLLLLLFLLIFSQRITTVVKNPYFRSCLSSSTS